MEIFNLTNFIIWFAITILILLIKYNWKRRWLYYYGSKLDGPFAWPLIGSGHLFVTGSKDQYQIVMSLCQKYPSVFKVWMGPLLVIVNSCPEDLEILLSYHLEKSQIYDFTKQMLHDGLLTSPVNTWKRHRKVINPMFNNKILNSFVDVFVKRSNKLVEMLKENCGEKIEVERTIWKCILEISCETFTDLDVNSIIGMEQYMEDISIAEEIFSMRVSHWLFYFDFFWKLSSLTKKMDQVCSRIYDFCKQLMTMKIRELHYQNDDLRKQRMLNQLIEKKDFSDQEILDEVNIMLIASSETSAVVQSMVLVVMGMYQDIQEKVYEELFSIFGNSPRDATLEDLNKMKYLERVIKETIRLFPPAPFIARQILEDFQLNSCFYPKGSTLFVPITYLHRKEEIWDNPLIFNPDRFLPENFKNRHKCSFIPFSYGPRNCIGFKYGFMSLKVMLSTILRNFKIISSNYKKVEDVDFLMHAIIAKPKDGILVELERRNGFKNNLI